MKWTTLEKATLIIGLAGFALTFGGVFVVSWLY